MRHHHLNQTFAGIAAALLGGCSIDDLAAEYYYKQPISGESTADSSSSSSSGSSSETSASSSGGSSSTGEGGSSTSSDASTSTQDTGDPASSSSGGPAVCGDGVVEGDEECDDGNAEDVDDCDNSCAQSWTIFVTSETMYTGKINGLVGADNRCRNHALNSPLANALDYSALISDSTTDAAERLHHARGWYRLVNGLPVAHGWDALMTGPLQNPVDVDELSQTTKTLVWTGTAPGGVAVPGAEHCKDWTVESFDLGHWGDSSFVDSNWLFRQSESNPTICFSPGALYCVQQPKP
ncbi:MAG: DUF4215 domain-containing protein [Myxococcales bacterium]|nr:DUF4215 domain-containing protein [Myxococcales bacterium]